MALPAGFPPASFRLEGGCLMYSTTAAALKLVSAAGLAPAVTRSQAEHVAATPRAVAPANGWRRGLGSCGDGRTFSLEHILHRGFGGPEGTCALVAVRKHPSRRQRVAPLIELRVRNGGKRW